MSGKEGDVSFPPLPSPSLPTLRRLRREELEPAEAVGGPFGRVVKLARGEAAPSRVSPTFPSWVPRLPAGTVRVRQGTWL